MMRNQIATKEIGVQMHGVKLNLRCDYDKLLDHTAALLNGHALDPFEDPDLQVNASWVGDPPADNGESVFPLEGLDRFGKRMHVGDNELVWSDTYRDKNLQLRFRKHGPVRVFDVNYQYRPSTKKLAKYPDYEHKKFFDLLRYLVLFPIAWHLERTRGWVMVHASAVAAGDRAILIAGPGGAGKTTTCVALLARGGMTLVTENLLFWDGARVFPVCEPIRLTEESLALLGDSAQTVLTAFTPPGGLKKKSMFMPSWPSDARGVAPGIVFLPQFSEDPFVRRIPPSIACELVLATNHLTLELNDYYWYASGLDLLWPKARNAEAQVTAIRRLTAAAPCYALGIDRKGGVEPVVDQILTSLNGTAQPVGGAR